MSPSRDLWPRNSALHRAKLHAGNTGSTEVLSAASRGAPAEVANFSQHHADQLDLLLSPVGNLMETFPELKEADARAWMGQSAVDPGRSLHADR